VCKPSCNLLGVHPLLVVIDLLRRRLGKPVAPLALQSGVLVRDDIPFVV